MTIKNLVISGGGSTGFISYGAIKQMNIDKFWELKNIESIFASSIGSFIGFVISLGYDWETLDQYIIDRPWGKAFSTIQTDLLEVYKNKGIDGEEVLKICTSPLLRGKNLSENITLIDLYKATNIELCLITTEVNLHKCLIGEVLSYKTAPNMTLNKALAASQAFPMVFKPVVCEDKIYIDGGVLHNFPLSICLNMTKCKENEILAFKNTWNSQFENNNLLGITSFMEYGATIFNKFHCTLESSKNQPEIKNKIESFISNQTHSFLKWWDILENKEKRESLVNQGIEDAKRCSKKMLTDPKTDSECLCQV